MERARNLPRWLDLKIIVESGKTFLELIAMIAPGIL